jgi:hypothetical protein
MNLTLRVFPAYPRSGETIAVNRGLNLRVMETVDEASRCLCIGPG